MANSRIQIYQDAGSEWRWRVIAGNNEIVAQGEGHTREADATRAAIRAASLIEQAIDTASIEYLE